MAPVDESIFRAYDIRGIYPDQLNEDVAYGVAQAYAKLFQPETVVLGRDVRTSGPALWDAATRGFMDHGVNVVDIGMLTTDMMYFAAAAYTYDGGVMISASHNPGGYNGMKLMRKGAVAVSGESGIQDIRALVAQGYRYAAPVRGVLAARDVSADYDAKCLSFIDRTVLKPFRVVANGMFGPVMRNVRRLDLPLELIVLNGEPDGTFPKGPPDPFLPENQQETIAAIKSARPDFGAAWDGDADRVFFFDEEGASISGYFLTAFLGAWFARKTPGAKIIHDPRLTWAIDESVVGAGGVPIENRVGHAFIKERMRRENAVFAGEMSGHFYFRDFFYADNGLIPFLLILEILSRSGKKLSELFAEYRARYFFSGEINTKLPSQDAARRIMETIRAQCADATIGTVDGLSVEYADWRANVRSSNTEPLLRLNVEARDPATLKQHTDELLGIIRPA